jgi:hypothetical protein
MVDWSLYGDDQKAEPGAKPFQYWQEMLFSAYMHGWAWYM